MKNIKYKNKIDKDAVVYVTCIKDWIPAGFDCKFIKNHIYKFYPQYSTVYHHNVNLEFFVGLKADEYFKKENFFITLYKMLRYE